MPPAIGRTVDGREVGRSIASHECTPKRGRMGVDAGTRLEARGSKIFARDRASVSTEGGRRREGKKEEMLSVMGETAGRRASARGQAMRR